MAKKKVKDVVEGPSKGKILFNNIYYFIIIIIVFGLIGYSIPVITTASAVSGTREYYEKFEENLDYYKDLDFSDQKLLSKLWITNYTTYNVVRKNIMNSYYATKDEDKNIYFNKLYDKYGETAVKAYYDTFVYPQYSGLVMFNYLIIFGIFLVFMQMIYKYFYIKGIYISSIIIILITLFMSAISFSYFDYIFLELPALLIVLINCLVNYYVFDKKALKKS